MRQDNNIEGFDNSNKTSNIEGITVVLYGGKDSFKVFYRGKDIEEATSHDLSELDDFLNNKENKLSPDMIKKINSFVARKLQKRKDEQAANDTDQDQGLLARLAGPATNLVGSVISAAGSAISAGLETIRGGGEN